MGAAAKDAEFHKNPENKKKFCHWMCNKKFRCNGEGHLARHHRQELEAAGVKVPSKGAGKGGSRSLGRYRNPRSSPQTRGYKRAIRALVDNELKYVQMIFDSGASCSAFPREIGEGYGIVKDEHAGYEYHGAGSENSAIKDEGCRAVQFLMKI